MVESLYDVCYVMECRLLLLLFFYKFFFFFGGGERLSSRDHCRKECRRMFISRLYYNVTVVETPGRELV